MNRQQRDFYKIFSQHGTGDAQVIIEPHEVLLLLHIAYFDVFEKEESWFDSEFYKISQKGLYNISYTDIDSLPKTTEDYCFSIIQESGVSNIENIFYLYFKNLCDLYRRRSKFHKILKTQPFPKSEQIVPRCLLEYGNCDNYLLSNWLEWRKWIFDIDNRSAQETGYIFEPILASCLGGDSVPASLSPVKRIDDNGNPTTKGRQIDCYLADQKEAYELKLRVSIAASGQGRFKEELSFAYEAQKAGITPILVVLDENPSVLLDKLKEQYINNGGQCYIGRDAWSMISERAGKEMGIFINKYIYPPIHSIETILESNPHNISLENSGNSISVICGDYKYCIKREYE